MNDGHDRDERKRARKLAEFNAAIKQPTSARVEPRCRMCGSSMRGTYGFLCWRCPQCGAES